MQVFHPSGEVLTGFRVDTITDMLTVLNLLAPVGYSGQVVATTEGNITAWQVQFWGLPGGIQVASLGDWVVYNSLTSVATGYPIALFTTLFVTALVNLVPRNILGAETFGRVVVA